MLSLKQTKMLAIAIPVALALGNLVPSNIFVSMATILAFLSFYLSTLGTSLFHQLLKTSALVCAACVVLSVPVVIFDAWFFDVNPDGSLAARIFAALADVTPFFTFAMSIGYAIYGASTAARLPIATKKAK